jgi:hypothetical protein
VPDCTLLIAHCSLHILKRELRKMLSRSLKTLRTRTEQAATNPHSMPNEQCPMSNEQSAQSERRLEMVPNCPTFSPGVSTPGYSRDVPPGQPFAVKTGGIHFFLFKPLLTPTLNHREQWKLNDYLDAPDRSLAQVA